MSVQKQKQTKLLLIGETGNGKSSAGNFILKKNVFRVSGSPDSETNKPLKCFGEGDRSDVVVIDTPGLNDTNKFDNEHIQNIVDCVRAEGLQGIILTMNYNVDKFTDNIKQVIETISDVFKIKDIWKRVCIVWTKCFNHFSKDEIKKKKIEKEKFKEKLTEFINQINKTNEYLDIPMYFVDSQPDERCDNSRSEYEIERLIEWGRGLELIDEEEIKKIISEYKEIRYEEKYEKGKILKDGIFRITYEKIIYRRSNKIKYNGKEIKGEWKWIGTRIKTKDKTLFESIEWGIIKVIKAITLDGVASVDTVVLHPEPGPGIFNSLLKFLGWY
ncbi:hypothetical protein ENUP19_0093G0005 [Entamoeba nuttalli]|uniref:AIG1-type G domain-containing protein n=1 Tax=Entamoeba nuttalli TaxID=412467 RepID=A0ABQ0DGV1_9EUKA